MKTKKRAKKRPAPNASRARASTPPPKASTAPRRVLERAVVQAFEITANDHIELDDGSIWRVARLTAFAGKRWLGFSCAGSTITNAWHVCFDTDERVPVWRAPRRGRP